VEETGEGKGAPAPPAGKRQIIPDWWLRKISGWLAIPGGLVLFCCMLMVTLDITMRRVANAPIAQTYDIAILSLLIGSTTTLAWVMTKRGHIEADIIFRKYTPGVKRVVSIIELLVSTCTAGLMAWGSYIWLGEAARVREVTLVLRWPTSYFITVEAVGFSLLTLVCVVQMVNAFQKREE
jgi:TRAP-type C4-dicarboxylate transport system permease small subunit